jgi:hypothetical protein
VNYPENIAKVILQQGHKHQEGKTTMQKRWVENWNRGCIEQANKYEFVSWEGRLRSEEFYRGRREILILDHVYHERLAHAYLESVKKQNEYQQLIAGFKGDLQGLKQQNSRLEVGIDKMKKSLLGRWLWKRVNR